MEWITNQLLNRPRLWTAVLVAFLAGWALIIAQRGVAFDNNLEGFLPASDPSIQNWRDFAERYEPDDVFIVVGFDADDVFAAETLRDLRALTDSLAALNDVLDVLSPVTFAGLRGTDDGISVEPYVGDTIPSDPDALAAIRRAVLADSAAVGYVVNRDADAGALYVQISVEANTYERRGVVLDEVSTILDPYRDRFDFRLSGFPYLRNEYVNLLQIQTVTYVGLASLVILFVLLWLFRNVRGVVLPLVTVYLGVIATVGTMRLFHAPIDVLTSTTATIILVVGVADSMHLLVKFYNALSEGLTKREAVRLMVRRLGAATFLTSLTTAIGFGTLMTSAVVPMKRFGLFTAIGVLLTFAISLVLVTVVLLAAPTPKPKQVERLGRGRFDGLLGWLDTFAAGHPRAILAGFAIVVAIALGFATQLSINTRINDDIGARSDLYQDLAWFEERLTTPWQFEVLLRSTPGAFKDADKLRQAEAVAAYLERQPDIRRVVVVTDLVKQLNQALHADSAAYYRLPEDPDLLAQQLFLLELTAPDVLDRFVDFDYGEVRVATLMNDVGSAEMTTIRADLDAFLAETLDADVEATATGTVVLASNLSDYLVRSLLLSIGLAFVFISILMGALFRNAKLVLASLIPNVIPLIIVAGIMGALSIKINPTTAVIFTIAFGIAVDDTIHFLARLRQEVFAGRPFPEAIRATMLGTGKAIILTSIVLLGGFGTLVTSDFQSTIYLGGLVSVTIALALITDLLLLPALLHLLKPKLTPKETQAPVAP